MKKIIFVRHAKSSWDYDVSDLERPLKKRGINDVHLVSMEFIKHNIKLDIVFSSPAKRAMETCKIFVNNLNINGDYTKIEDQLYDFGGNKVINFIKALDNCYSSIMIFGHNHALTYIVNTYGSSLIDNLPTCGLAILEFDIDSWYDLQKGQTLHIIFPRDLKD